MKHTSFPSVRYGILVPPIRRYPCYWEKFFSTVKPGGTWHLDDEKRVCATLTAARRLGVGVTSRKNFTGGWDMWRVK